MSEAVRQENLQFTENKEYDGTLGILRGPVADFLHATRNGRKYSERLWNKVFNSDIVKEMFENGGIPGELDHPVDRSEICSEKIAILMPEPPKKNSKGELTGMFKILDTPCGRILYALAKAGFNIGVSSRATGDTYEDENGDECVDEDTYDFQCFDAVILPAVKTARMRLVNESLDQTKAPSLKQTLNEAFERSTDEEKELMQQTLNNLDIEIEDNNDADESEELTIDTVVSKAISDANSEITVEELINSDTFREEFYSFLMNLLLPNKEDNIDGAESNVDSADAAEDSGADDVINELQEALVKQQDLELQVKNLQEKLSVCYTKEARYSEFLSKSKSKLTDKSSQLEDAEKTIKSLHEELQAVKSELKAKSDIVSTLRAQIKNSRTSAASLNEDLRTEKQNVSKLNEQVKKLTADFTTQKQAFESEKAGLLEKLADTAKDAKIVKSQAEAKLTSCNQLIERYKSVAKTAVDKYIQSQASRIGISADTVRSKLPENYSFRDIDAVCESLRTYKLKANALPFDLESRGPLKTRVVPSKERISVADEYSQLDDNIDGSWINI